MTHNELRSMPPAHPTLAPAAPQHLPARPASRPRPVAVALLALLALAALIVLAALAGATALATCDDAALVPRVDGHWPQGWPLGWQQDWLQAGRQQLLALQALGPWAFALGFVLVFTLLSALALPGCSVLALAAGPCFGWLAGTLLVTLAATAGATLSFLAARHWWREPVRRRWGHRLAALDAGLARDGACYVLLLRLAPVIPFALLNPLLGLSSLSMARFVGASLLGMLAGSAAYVWAGAELGGVRQWPDLLSPGLAAALSGLALLPWLARRALQHAGTAR